MPKVTCLFAALISQFSFAENLPVPSQLAYGHYVVTSQDNDENCFDAYYDGKSVEGGKAIWFNARSLIRLMPDERFDNDLKPGCFDHVITTSDDDGQKTTLVTTELDECKGKKSIVTAVTTYVFSHGKVERHEVGSEGYESRCNWKRSR